jgi:hypothetical protein
MRWAVLGLIFVAAVSVLGSSQSGENATASNPGTTNAPLLSCSDVTGDGPVSSLDFFGLLGKFGTAYHPTSPTGLSFSYLYDLSADNAVAGSDFFTLLGDFNSTCPPVDSELARATLAILGMGPGVMDCDEAALAYVGYTRSSSDVPGQGVHYVNRDYWDGVFEPEHPEGLVCDNAGGRLVAQLYVVDGHDVGWVEDPGLDPDLDPDAGSCWDGVDNGDDGYSDAGDADCQSVSPLGSPLDDVDIDPLCNVAECSWSGDEGWHLHYNLCTTQIGTPQAFAFPGVTSEAQCEQNHCAGLNPPQAPPCGAVFGVDYSWSPRVGWMGHLWNHKLNENLIEDGAGMNGRFADCYPDGGVWKAHNCPQ